MDVIALLDVAGDPMQVVGGVPFVSPVVLNNDARIGVCRGSVIIGQSHPAGRCRVEGCSLRRGKIDAGVDHRSAGGAALTREVETAKLWHASEMLAERVTLGRHGPDANIAPFRRLAPFRRRLFPFRNGTVGGVRLYLI